jgi:Bacterial Ig-like domain (group 3)
MKAVLSSCALFSDRDARNPPPLHHRRLFRRHEFRSQHFTGIEQVVHRATTTTMLVSSLNPPIDGPFVTLTATVVPHYSGTPTSTVTFKNGTATTGKVLLTGGRAIFSKVFKSAETKSITVSYSGNANFTPSSAELPQTFN